LNHWHGAKQSCPRITPYFAKATKGRRIFTDIPRSGSAGLARKTSASKNGDLVVSAIWLLPSVQIRLPFVVPSLPRDEVGCNPWSDVFLIFVLEIILILLNYEISKSGDGASRSALCRLGGFLFGLCWCSAS